MGRHVPVLLHEMLHYLSPKDHEIILDCTFGAGGYAKAILDSSLCNVISIDQDPDVISYSEELSVQYPKRFTFILDNFLNIGYHLKGQVDGIVLDLGVSTLQLSNPDRGFSFQKEGILDMRMNKIGLTAKDFIENVSEKDLADIIYKYGNERHSRKIAQQIVAIRIKEPIVYTTQLANIVRECVKHRTRIDAATKTFQAIRIHLNQELIVLQKTLEQIPKFLKIGGRVVVISFHSLEDKIIKQNFINNSNKRISQSKYHKEAILNYEKKIYKILTKKTIVPNMQEIKSNVKSRSAKLRAVLKINDLKL